MKVEYSEVQKSFEDLSSLAGENKQATYALIKIRESGIEVCYADSSVTYNKRIDGEAEEGDTQLDAIVDVKMFSKRLDLFKTTGNIHLEPLSITVDGDSLNLHSKKYLMIASYDDETGDFEVDSEGNAITTNVTGMEVETRVRYYDVSSNVRFSITTRTPYEKLYEAEGDGFISIERAEFIGLLDKLVKTLDSPVCAIHGPNRIAFSPGRSYTTKINIENTDLPAFGIGSAVAVKLVNIFKKCDNDNIKLLLTPDRKFIKLVSEDEQLAMMVMNISPSQSAVASLVSYDSTAYDILRMQFNREMFTNLVKGSLLVVEGGVAASKVQFQYDEETDKVKMLISKKGAGSTEDALHIIAENYTGNIQTLTSTSINVVFKLLDQALSTCEQAVIEVKLGNSTNTKVLRIADIERNVVTQETISEKAVYYMCV